MDLNTIVKAWIDKNKIAFESNDPLIKKVFDSHNQALEDLTSRIPELEGMIEKEMEIKISQLRQWLNEDRIDNPKKMITNEDIKHWLEIINTLSQKEG